MRQTNQTLFFSLCNILLVYSATMRFQSLGLAGLLCSTAQSQYIVAQIILIPIVAVNEASARFCGHLQWLSPFL